jgi:hypothetical protein
MHQPVQPKSLSRKRWAIHLYSNTPPHVQAPQGRIRGYWSGAVIILINAPAGIRTQDLWLTGSGTILSCMHQPVQPKSLSR